MVLVMQAYIIGQVIENPVIREGFRDDGVS